MDGCADDPFTDKNKKYYSESKRYSNNGITQKQDNKFNNFQLNRSSHDTRKIFFLYNIVELDYNVIVYNYTFNMNRYNNIINS